MLFQTEHLSVRQFRHDDLNDFSDLCADPNVMRFVGDWTVLSRPEVSQWIEICERKYVDRGYGTSAVFNPRRAAFKTISEAYSQECDSSPMTTSASRVIARIPQWMSE